MNAVLDAARSYEARGWAVLPLPAGEKSPVIKDWPSLRLKRSVLDEHFGREPRNIGVLLGTPSGNLARVDLDCPEAVVVARLLLPHTDLVMGRPGNPNSGYFYYIPDGLDRSHRFKDPTAPHQGAMLVELLWTGKQTVIPPSVHPDGDRYKWVRDGEPVEVGADELLRAVKTVAAAALLARHWPVGARHEAALALSGGLLSDGMPLDQAEVFIQAVLLAAGDEEPEDRLTALRDTARQIEAGNRVRRWNALVS